MAKRSVTRRKIEIDPMFFIPEGMDDFTYSDRNDLKPDDFADNDPDITYDIDDGGDSTDPQTPNILGIDSQTLRRTAAGHVLVDVVLLVEDIEGVSNYEVRITKT